MAASIGSTAGVLFYSDTVTYDNNVTEQAEYIILPYPVMEDGKSAAIQRGGGMCITKSNEAREAAAGIFLKWFTSPEQNSRFVASTGYIPVTTEAMEITSNDRSAFVDDKIRMLLDTSREMAEKYIFFYTPTFENFDDLQDDFNKNIKSYALQCKSSYFELLKTMDINHALEEATKNKYEEFINMR